MDYSYICRYHQDKFDQEARIYELEDKINKLPEDTRFAIQETLDLLTKRIAKLEETVRELTNKEE